MQMQTVHIDMQGVLPAVANLLHSHHSEVHVRALLALGMLVGSSQDNQIKLANIEGTLSRLLVLRLQQDDEDSKHIAGGIVAAMVNLLTLAGNSFAIGFADKLHLCCESVMVHCANMCALCCTAFCNFSCCQNRHAGSSREVL